MSQQQSRIPQIGAADEEWVQSTCERIAKELNVDPVIVLCYEIFGAAWEVPAIRRWRYDGSHEVMRLMVRDYRVKHHADIDFLAMYSNATEAGVLTMFQNDAHVLYERDMQAAY